MKAEADFWDWFVRNEPKLFGFRADREGERKSLFDAAPSWFRDITEPAVAEQILVNA